MRMDGIRKTREIPKPNICLKLTILLATSHTKQFAGRNLGAISAASNCGVSSGQEILFWTNDEEKPKVTGEGCGICFWDVGDCVTRY